MELEFDPRATALELLGQFTRLQEAIDGAARMYFQEKTPGLEQFVHKRALSRLKDEERLSLLQSLMGELDIEPPSLLKPTFNSVKATRDRIAHASSIQVGGDGELVLGQGSWWGPKIGELPSPIRIARDELVTLKNRCEWLMAWVRYTFTSAPGIKEVRMGTGTSNVGVAALRPTNDPSDWDGILWREIEPN